MASTTKKLYYYSPSENVTKTRSIPACTAENLHITNQTLKGDAGMCYGVNGLDVIIITKRLFRFYGVTDDITAPVNPIDFSTDVPPRPNSGDRNDSVYLSWNDYICHQYRLKYCFVINTCISYTRHLVNI